MSKLAMYLRLSVEEQSTRFESESISNQRNFILNYLKSNEEFKGYKIVEFADDGFSGSNTKRPGFEKMMEAIKFNEVKVIVVKDFSRFMRDYIGIGDYLENIFPFMGVRFISINDNYDSKNEVGNGTEIDVQFKNLINDFYTKDASQKVRSVQNALKEKGKFLAWQPPYGYMKDPNDRHKIIVDAEVAHIVKEAFELSYSGLPTRKIARIFNEKNYITPYRRKKQTSGMDYSFMTTTTKNHKEPIWMHGTIIKILGNENYTGTYCYNMVRRPTVGSIKTVPVPKEDWGRVYDNHEAIVSRELFDKVQEAKAKRSFKNVDYTKIHEPRYPLDGYLICSTCGHKLARSTNPRKKRILHYIFCRTCKIKGDSNKRHRLDSLENKAWEEVKNKITFTKETNKEIEKEILPTKQERIDKLLKEKDTAFYNYKHAKLSRESFIELKKDIDKQVDEINQEVEVTTHEKPEFKCDTEELTRDLVKQHIDKVLVDFDGNVEVYLKNDEVNSN